jgi:hypothetical protein
MDEAKDGGLVLAGMTIDARANVVGPRNAMWLVKTDCMGNDNTWDSVGCAPDVGVREEKQELIDLKIQPNPANDNFKIELGGLKENSKNKLILYNATGLIEKEIEIQSGQTDVLINSKELAQGVYMLILISDDIVIDKTRLLIIH